MTPSFDDFVAAQVTPLLRYATVLTCDPHLAQDVVQEVLLRAQQRWDRISRVDLPAAYVKRMVTNEFLSWRRRREAKNVALSTDTLEHISPAVPDTSHHYDEREAMLQRISQLPRKQRAAIVLRYYEHYDDAEIAKTLGCAEGTVRSHISRALATLRLDYSPEPAAAGLRLQEGLS
ncbi:SigE family RNA polymerase sigma factor [Lentzea sp. NBRC 105346]|uniref:SigE family RNA polymerase sigma factor n=1 Tax=Lentzea sp. NBRC 105346 TaxID=3032205 RepID=UPI002556FE09|nr:SigE family RNA polymerase sigma factor [Lentzea sp. NBRC 105346]